MTTETTDTPQMADCSSASCSDSSFLWRMFTRSRLPRILKKAMAVSPALRPLGRLIYSGAKVRSTDQPKLQWVSSEALPRKVHECIFGVADPSVGTEGISQRALATLKTPYVGEIPRNLPEPESIQGGQVVEQRVLRKLV